MTMVDGGALVGKALANEGVEKAFVLCGGHIMSIFYGMRNAGIEIIDMRHECAAIYAAIAYTRAAGKMAVVVTTAGPGVGNTPSGSDPLLWSERDNRDRARSGRRGLGGQPETGLVVYR